MAVKYPKEGERFRNICTVSVPQEVDDVLTKWKINLTLIAGQMGMNRGTLYNKLKGNLNTGFTPDEYREFINVLRNMVNDLDPVLKNYPKFDE